MNFCLAQVNPVTPTTQLPQITPIPSPGLEIRSARLQDIKGLVDVLMQSFHGSATWLVWLNPLLRLGILEDLRSRLRGNLPYYHCLVALVTGDEIVGTVEICLRGWFSMKTATCYISNLAVEPSHRRQGIARQLLVKCEKIACSWNCQSLALHVMEDNWGAKSLYFGLGYQCQKTEGSFPHLLFHQPRRLLLEKRLN